MVSGSAKAGALAVPVFAKKIVLPKPSPTKASRSPSPSRSAKAGDALRGSPRSTRTLPRPKAARGFTKLGGRASAGSPSGAPRSAAANARRARACSTRRAVRHEAPRMRRSRASSAAGLAQEPAGDALVASEHGPVRRSRRSRPGLTHDSGSMGRPRIARSSHPGESRVKPKGASEGHEIVCGQRGPGYPCLSLAPLVRARRRRSARAARRRLRTRRSAARRRGCAPASAERAPGSVPSATARSM